MNIVEDGFKRHNSKPQYPITNQCSNWKILECELHVVLILCLKIFTTVRPTDNITYKYVFLCVCHDLLISKIKSTNYSIV